MLAAILESEGSHVSEEDFFPTLLEGIIFLCPSDKFLQGYPFECIGGVVRIDGIEARDLELEYSLCCCHPGDLPDDYWGVLKGVLLTVLVLDYDFEAGNLLQERVDLHPRHKLYVDTVVVRSILSSIRSAGQRLPLLEQPILDQRCRLVTEAQEDGEDDQADNQKDSGKYLRTKRVLPICVKGWWLEISPMIC